MRAMRVLAKVFIGVGLGLDLLYALLYLFLVKLAQQFSNVTILQVLFWFLLIYFIGAIVLAVFLYRSINNDSKSTLLGVLGLLLLSVAGGVFYLIWQPEDCRVKKGGGLDQPERDNSIEIGKSFEATFGPDYKERVLKVDDKVMILDDANDVIPIVKKGSIFYVYRTDGAKKPWNKRYTKVFCIDKEGKAHKYNFHSYVFKKIGTRTENN